MGLCQPTSLSQPLLAPSPGADVKEPEITTQGVLAMAVCPSGVDRPPQASATLLHTGARCSLCLRGASLQGYPEDRSVWGCRREGTPCRGRAGSGPSAAGKEQKQSSSTRGGTEGQGGGRWWLWQGVAQPWRDSGPCLQAAKSG